MDINRDNYESWLLDKVEGKLSAEQLQQLHDFLLLNPDCVHDLDEFKQWAIEPWALEPGKLNWEGKSGLRKEIPHEGSVVLEKDFDLFSIARMEGDLTRQQEEDFQDLLDQDEKKLEEWLGWEKMRLVGETIDYERKRELKRSAAPRFRVIWMSVASAAAAIILFFTLIWIDQDVADPGGFSEHEALVDARQGQEDHEMEDIDAHPGQAAHETMAVDAREPEEATSISGRLAAEPTILSIRKHQDPPELTGEKLDSTSRPVQPESIKPGPLKIASLDRELMQTVGVVSYDRIEPNDLIEVTGSPGEVVMEEFSERGLKQVYRDFVKKNDISLLTIANAGIEGINFLAGSDLSLDISRGPDGEVSGYRFRSQQLSVDAPVKKAE